MQFGHQIIVGNSKKVSKRYREESPPLSHNLPGKFDGYARHTPSHGQGFENVQFGVCVNTVPLTQAPLFASVC